MKVIDAQIEEACSKGTSMKEAAKEVGLSFGHFKNRAIALGCYRPRPGITDKSHNRIDLQIILQGKCPSYSTNGLKKRLIDVGIKERKCERCGMEKWLGRLIPLELHHKNGCSDDHRLANLEVLCPNCHALTDNYKGKCNKKEGKPSRERKVAMSDKTCVVCGKRLTVKQKETCSVACRSQRVRELERSTVDETSLVKALKSGGSIQGACRILGVSDPTIRKWSKRFGLDIKVLIGSPFLDKH